MLDIAERGWMHPDRASTPIFRKLVSAPSPYYETKPVSKFSLFARSARLVRGVLFVFVADVLEHVGVRKKLLDEVDGDRPGEGFRIGNRHGDIHMSEIAPVEALLDAHVLAVPVAACVQPAEIVESQGID